MPIIINTPSGNIGRTLTAFLLEAGADVTIISRHPDKVADLVDHGAKLVLGSMDDPNVLKLAMQGGGVLFWLTPPVLRADFRDWALRTAEQAIMMGLEHGVDQVVLLSSAGAQAGPGAGPVSVLGEVEELVGGLLDNVIIQRPASFMENLLAHLPTIARDGAFYLPLPPDKAFPMVATRDIANQAAGLLMQDGWTGRRIVGVQGPVDLSHAQAAQIISAELGRSIHFVQVSPDQARQAMLAQNLPDFAVESYLDLFAAMADGQLDPAEPRTAETTTPTSLAQFVREVMKPALGNAAEA